MSKQNIAITTVEYILVAGFIIFEELIWNVLAKPIIDRLNQNIFIRLRYVFIAMNRHCLLTVFVAIFTLTEYLGIVSGIAMVSGHIGYSVLIYLLKIPLAAFTFWLFSLTKPKLMTFTWLKLAYEHLIHWTDQIKKTSIYQSTKNTIAVFRSKISSLRQKYLGEGGLIESAKTQYMLIKTFFIRP